MCTLPVDLTTLIKMVQLSDWKTVSAVRLQRLKMAMVHDIEYQIMTFDEQNISVFT